MRLSTLILFAAAFVNAAEPPKDKSPTDIPIFSDKDCKNQIDKVTIELTENNGKGGACYDFTKYAGKYFDDPGFSHSVLRNYKDSECKDQDGKGNKIPAYEHCMQVPDNLYFKWENVDTPDIGNPLCCA